MEQLTKLVLSDIASAFEQLFDGLGDALERPALLNADGGGYSYGQLEDRANHLAGLAYAKGVRRGQCVAICLPRGPLFVAVALGVMKIGAHYCPIDPRWPRARRAQVARNAGAALLFAAEGALADEVSLETVVLTHGRWEATGAPRVVTERSVDDAMWVLFTSGSSGAPKKVVGGHRAACLRIEWMWKEQPFEDGEVFFQNTAFTTVDSYWEIFGPLLRGHAVVIPDEATASDPRLLLACLDRFKIRRICMVPSLLKVLLGFKEIEPGLLSTLKRCVVSGEMLEAGLCAKFHEKFEKAELYNQYGLTETCADITSFPTKAWQKKGGGNARVPVGRAFPGVVLTVRDGAGRKLEAGEVGEVHVAGPCLSSSLEGRIRYFSGVSTLATGDLGSLDEDGILTCWGRVDAQFKIRGHRIDPAEIEEVLSKVPGLVLGIVSKETDSHHREHLVAHILFAPGIQGDIGQVRLRLQELLPPHMLPTELKVLPRAYYTSTGKLDRKRTVQLTKESGSGDQDGQEPSKDTAEKIIRIFSEILGKPIRMEDDFFSIGGHSLAAMQVLLRLESDLGIRVSMRRFEENASALALREFVEEGRAAPDILAERGQAPLSLSSQQSRLWYLNKLYPKSKMYHMCSCFKVEGALDHRAFAEAVQDLVRSQPQLRLAILDEEGRPCPKLLEPGVFKLKRLRTPGLGEAELLRKAAKLCYKPFDMEKGGLTRFQLLQHSTDLNYVLVSIHHVVADGYSAQIIKEQLFRAYSGRKGEGTLSATSTGLTYFDYVAEQKRAELKAGVSSSVRYWTNELKGCPTESTLPPDRPRRKEQEFSGGFARFSLTRGQAARLREMSAASGYSVFACLFACLGLTLGNYQEEDEVVVGMPLSTRRGRAYEDVAGFFVNNVPIRVDLGGSPTYLELVGRVQEKIQDAMTYGDLSFEKIVECSGVERNVLQNPLFQCEFTFQNVGIDGLQVPGLSFREMELPERYSKFDLSLILFEKGSEITGGFEYKRSLYDQGTIERFLKNFLFSLENLLERGSQKIDSFPRMAGEELKRLTREFSGAARRGPRQRDLFWEFLASARKHPGKKAIIHQKTSVSFRQLLSRTEEIAGMLEVEGIGAGAVVGIYCDREPDLVASILAVLSLGAAYLPIDKSLPADRIQGMLLDAGAALTLVDGRKVLPAGGKTLSLSAQFRLKKAQKWTRKRVDTSDLTAYILFTSGTTGRPKGVPISQGNLISFFRAFDGVAKVGRESKWIALARASFDISVIELLWTMTRGVTLLLEDTPAEASSGHGIAKAIAEHRITHLQATPSVLRLILVEPGAARDIAGLRQIFCGGEFFAGDLVQKLHRTYKGDLFNLYGPTEATIYQTFQRLEVGGDSSVIGRPLENSRIYVADRSMRLMPMGAYGEILVGGHGVARGYISDEFLSATRFLPNIYEPEDRCLVYRSGDTGRFLADGSIQIRGRIDRQIKLMGNRIELMEIEAALNAVPGVEACHVAVRSTEGSPQLVAFLCGKKGPRLDAASIRTALGKKLPGYMVPNLFAWRDFFVINKNGKIDSAAMLKEFSPQEELQQSGTAGDLSDDEAEVLKIFCDVLNVPGIGVSQDFFDLGGNSLMATQVSFKLRKKFGVGLSLRDFLNHPTVSGVAALLKRPLSVGGARARLRKARGAYDVLPVQAEMLQRMQALGSTGLFDIPFAFKLSPAVSSAGLSRALADVIRRNPAFQGGFSKRDGRWVWKFGRKKAMPFRLRRVHLPQGTSDSDAMNRMALALAGSLDPLKGKFLSAVHLKCGDRAWLGINIHHLISDLRAIKVFLQELGESYGVGPRPAEPPKKGGKKESFFRALDALSAGQEKPFSVQEYFGDLSQLAGRGGLEKREGHKGAGAGAWRSRLARKALDRLRGNGRLRGYTDFQAFLAMFALFLSQREREARVVIGLPIDQFPEDQEEAAIGPFFSTAAVRFDLQGKGLVDALAAASAGLRRAHELPGMSMSRMVGQLNMELIKKKLAPFKLEYVLNWIEKDEGSGWKRELGAGGFHIFGCGDAKTKLGLYVYADEDGFDLLWEYDKSALESEALEGMALDFKEFFELTCEGGLDAKVSS